MDTRDTSRPPAVEQFVAALHAGDVEGVRKLLENHAEVRDAINEPISWFDSRPVARAVKNLPLLDLLLQYGADLNLKSEWWAGGFGILETGVTPAEARPLIERGATVDVFAAAHLGMFERLHELVEADPSLTHARGGDGKTPLHCACTVEIAEYLLSRGADIDARCVDHESTPAQYLVREAPEVTRFLVENGAWCDIFMAVGLRDVALVERCLRDDPEALDHRIGHGKYRVRHDGKRAATADEIGDGRGDIYRWVLVPNASALDVAMHLGNDEIVERMLAHASPAQHLLAACARADRAGAEAILAAHPNVVADLTEDQMRLICHAAHANRTGAVLLMLELGFDPLARGVDDWEPLRWAAFHGNAAMTEALLPHSPPLNVPDPSYGGTPLGQCLYGALHGWHRHRGNHAATVRLLLEAGEKPDPAALPTGRDDVDAVLRRALAENPL